MIYALFIFIASFVCSVIAVGLMIKISHKRAWYDHVNERKIHSGDVPRLGGIGFALVFIIAAAVICFSTRKLDSSIRLLPCLGGLVLTLIFGVIDDFRPMPPKLKLLIQFIAAVCVIIPGYTFHRMIYFETGFLGGLLSGLGWLGYPVSLLWLVGLSNAMNLIDGVDGLAGGLSALIAVTFGLIFLSYAETPQPVLFCVSLFGVLLGFLIFNAPIPRATIFMGDCGSQFLGFSLALLPLLEEHKTTADLPVLYAAALLAIPIFDTTAAVLRRIRDGKKIDSPDRAHIHHKLMNLGLNARQTVAALYALQILLCALVYISVRVQGVLSLIILGSAYCAVMAFFAVVHFLNRTVMLKNQNMTTAADGNVIQITPPPPPVRGGHI
ncbi:MAG: undecaprenyl/decaprenyl-phosphate alpha-N-acetylglucosaminyl 1-phosphate transferase [Treponema sp.]|jgi:UDP-GlcNAc:undecaprenyl-phosphate GlcNAc-1-phosphate transferase|nr:undecaprenyl/decaprenyl-phosphate alpha-N-acetylglucosaminyl 1-phosphate transferase [Treponema sp.]